MHVAISRELEEKERVKGGLKKMITTHDNLPIAHNVGWHYHAER